MCQAVVDQEGLSIQGSCELVSLSWSMWYYKSRKDDTEVIDKLIEMSEIKPNRGFDFTITAYANRALYGTENGC